MKFMLGVVFTGCLGMLIYGSATWLLQPVTDRENVRFGKKTWILAELSFGNAAVITWICQMEGKIRIFSERSRFCYLSMEGILLGLLAGGLLAAAVMDEKSCYVYNYIWWWCGLWAVLLLWLPVILGTPVGAGVGETLTKGEQVGTLPEITIHRMAAVAGFVMLQQCLFAQMYGRADSHAFSVCALVNCHFRGTLFWFLMHMLLAVALLAVIQLKNGNVTQNGKLRTPKPFVPYIMVTFWLEIPAMLCLQINTRITHIYA